MSRLGLHCIAALFGVCAVVGSAAAQQDFPNRPMHVVIGFAAGGGADILTRWYAAKLAEATGQSVVVDAGGNGADRARPAPDEGFFLRLGKGTDPGHRLS